MAKTTIKNKAKEIEADEEEQTQAPAKKKGSLSSLASAFNNSTGLGGLSVGKHEANITSMEFIENEKGKSVMVEYKAAEGDDDEGKKMKQYYQLEKAEGTIGGGVDFLVADLKKLGYEDLSFDDLENYLREITKEEPLVEIKVVQNGNFLNAYLQGVIETD